MPSHVSDLEWPRDCVLGSHMTWSAFKDFSRCSGLKPSLEKSLVFFSNVPAQVKVAILKILPFYVGTLPIKYLGVPFISSRLHKHHCALLIDKVKIRLSNWKNKAFSFARMLQLINSVVSSLQVYWSSVFILPKSVTNDIEKLMRGFIWAHGDSIKGKAKVKWKDVCSLKVQGGLAGLSLSCKIADIVINEEWKWPERNNKDTVCPYSVKTACTDLSTTKSVVPCFKIVWFSLLKGILEFSKMKSRSVEEMCAVIREYVRLRLLSLKIKRSKNSLEAAEI
ncbi:hypothetical protein Tco_0862410 [Tanacetum coccineum]